MSDFFRGREAGRDMRYVQKRTNSSQRHSSWDKLRTYGVDKVFGGEGTPAHEEYLDKLADPRWEAFTDLVKQARRICESCGFSRHLQVHHIRYLPGLEPWEHPLSEVKLLCVDCHSRVHRIEPTKAGLPAGLVGGEPSVARPVGRVPQRRVPLNAEALWLRIDQWVTVDGVAETVRTASNGNTYVSLGGKYPDAVLTIVIFPNSLAEFSDLKGVVGKVVSVSGRIQEYHRAIQIVANSAKQIVLP